MAHPVLARATRMGPKLVLACLALSLVPLATVTSLTLRRSTAQLEQSAGDQFALVAADTIDKIDRNLFERYGDVQAFAFHPAARGDADEVRRAADFFTRSYGVYDLMVIADLDGRIVATNGTSFDGKPLDVGALAGRSVRGQEWFEKIARGEVKRGETYYADFAEDPLMKQVFGGRGVTLMFAAPIFDESGNLVRVWSNRASEERIVGQILDEVREGLAARGFPTTETQLVSKTGLLLHDADASQEMALDLAAKGLLAVQEGAAGRSGFTREPHERTGVEQVVGYAASKGALGFAGYGWTVLVREATDQIFAPVAALQRLSAIAVGAAALLTVVVAFLFARSIAVPLSAVTEAVREMARGGLVSSLRIQRGDEIGDIASALEQGLAGMREVLGVDRVD